VKIGQTLSIPNDGNYEIVGVRGASIFARKIGHSALFWIIEDDLPRGTIIH
jgi:hypothetical protein